MSGGTANEDGDTTIRDVTREDGTVTVVLPSSRPHSTEPEKQTAHAQDPAMGTVMLEPPQEEDKKLEQLDDGMLCYKLDRASCSVHSKDVRVIKSAEIEIEIADRDSGTVLVSRQTNKNFLQTNKNFQTN